MKDRKMDIGTDKLLAREVKKISFLTAWELKGMHASLLRIATVRTIQPLLTRKNLKAGFFVFCKAFEHRTLEDWSRVVLSDESTFKIVSKEQKKVYRLQQV